jgi:hypothetical protein
MEKRPVDKVTAYLPCPLTARLKAEVSQRRRDDGEPHALSEVVEEAVERHLAAIEKRRAKGATS